ncbi:hypothetical protein [Serratia plymuthica]|uniref:hypothetical protein n=1 Tax=Serratia plymuthica TaxID=82996 RepID=UPI0018D96B02|nr:hypothetical protein [Serratia plymuthica]QPS57634.1 hypothetical protein I6G53_09080 [Serratia plymuthica]CAI1539240.1 Uncharacterised protein [Serratia plymuthica]
MTETKYLQSVLKEIGYSVHNLNTIAVALSNLPSNSELNPALNIKWEPKNLEQSCFSARRFAVRSSLVFAVETLFEYMCSISNDVMWKKINFGLNFKAKLSTNDSKARRFSEFCKSIPGIEKEWYLLVELMCHWRNRIVHASTSNAELSSSDKKFLESKNSILYDNFYHFDVKKMLEDYDVDKVTLKEATTLITFLIKCCRKIDEHYFSSISFLSDQVYCDILDNDNQFTQLINQSSCAKRTRQITKYIEITLCYLSAEKRTELANMYKDV